MAHSDTAMPLDRSAALALGAAVAVLFVASVLYALLTLHSVVAVVVSWVWLLLSGCFLYLLWRLVRAVEEVARALE